MCKNVFFKVNTRCNFDEHQAAFCQFKHSAFSDIKNIFAQALCIVSAEGNLLYMIHKLAALSFLKNTKFSVFNSDFQTAGRECSAEDNPLCILSNIDKTAASRNLRPKFADIDIAGFIALGRPRNAISKPPPS